MIQSGVPVQKKWGWKCRYVQQYHAIGEAPDEVRQCFQQRSRWCKGHFQTFWSKQCPLVDRRLGLFFQLCYSSTCLSYISAGWSLLCDCSIIV
jgi:endoglucanase